eukprot:1776776-Alexandrium_andersonii.AAC.1
MHFRESFPWPPACGRRRRSTPRHSGGGPPCQIRARRGQPRESAGELRPAPERAGPQGALGTLAR